jgi:hypothetical protein
MRTTQTANTTDWPQNDRADLYRIERETTKQISIETHPTPQNLARCNPQCQSPLFTKIPPELRNRIFSLALLQYEDLSQPYEQQDYCYRPGHRARRIVSTSLLQTCRLIWLEANHWPMSQAVHSFWFDDDRRPAWASAWPHSHGEHNRMLDFFAVLTDLQCSRVKHLQIFAHMGWLEGDFRSSRIWRCLDREPLNLDTFTITIRHSDWWHWETDEPLWLPTCWPRTMLQSPRANRIDEIRLELETLERKVDQLRHIVEKLKLAGEAREGGEAQWELVVDPLDETTWSGPVDLGGQQHAIYAHCEKLDYRVITMKWRRRRRVAAETEQRWREEGSLLTLCEPARIRTEEEENDDEEFFY